MFEVLLFGFTQGFVIGPVSLFGIHEGLEKGKGFFYQIQVTVGSSLISFAYLLLAAYGAAHVVDQFYVRLIMWLVASYMLIMMGVNTIHERPRKLSAHHFHGLRKKLLESDFLKGGFLALVNPLSLVFWIMVAGGLYADVKDFLSPWFFALLVMLGTLVSSLLVAIATFFVKKIFHEKMLKYIYAEFVWNIYWRRYWRIFGVFIF